MAQARTPAGTAVGSGAGEYIVTATQIPTDITWDQTVPLSNTQSDLQVHYEIKDSTLFSGTCEATSSDFVFSFHAQNNGRIVGIQYTNGAVAADGSSGWELQFLNTDQSNAVCAYFGIGSGTEAAKGTDTTTAAAGAQVEIPNSITSTESHFNRGDRIVVTS